MKKAQEAEKDEVYTKNKKDIIYNLTDAQVKLASTSGCDPKDYITGFSTIENLKDFMNSYKQYLNTWTEEHIDNEMPADGKSFKHSKLKSINLIFY